MKIRTLLLSILFVSIAATGQNPATENALRLKHFWLVKTPVAIQGYDPVSYYHGKALKGGTAFKTVFKAIEYHFATAKNLEAFLKNPASYEPAYGGWCAYAMGAKAEKVEPDPENFKLTNGKVYLFYKNFFSNTLTDWNEDEANLKKKADVAWLKLIP
jgi:YHS domain-containing protein